MKMKKKKSKLFVLITPLLLCAACNFSGIPESPEDTCGNAPESFVGKSYDYTLTFVGVEDGEAWTVTGTMDVSEESNGQPTGQKAVIGRSRTYAVYSYDVTFSEATYSNGGETFQAEAPLSSAFGMQVECNLKRGFESALIGSLDIENLSKIVGLGERFAPDDASLWGSCEVGEFAAGSTEKTIGCRTMVKEEDAWNGITYSDALESVKIKLVSQ